jgi:hypothetical protein
MSCSTFVKQGHNVESDGLTVDFENKSNENAQGSKEILIEDGNYGPIGTSVGESGSESNSKKILVTAGIMPITKYSLYAYVGLLKAFEYADIKLRIINGTGIASYFASFLANQGTSSLLEWNILKVFNEKVELNKDEINDEVFSQVFSIDSQKKIEELNHLVFISTYNKQNNKIQFYNKGRLFPVLRLSLEHSSEASLIFPSDVLKTKGADKVVGFVFDEDKFIKKEGNAYLVENYNKVMLRVFKEKGKLDYLCIIKVKTSHEKQIIIKTVYEQAVKCALEINKMVSQ